MADTASPEARRLERLETLRRQLFESLAGLDEERMNRPPEPGRWSIVQVMSHVIRAEELSLSYIRKKLQDPSAVPDATLTAPLRLAALAAVLRSPLRFRAPARTAEVPESEPPDETMRRWDEVRAGWRQLVDSYPPELVRKAIYRHPYAGRLSLAQALVFLEEHFVHHRKQIDRLRAAV